MAISTYQSPLHHKILGGHFYATAATAAPPAPPRRPPPPAEPGMNQFHTLIDQLVALNKAARIGRDARNFGEMAFFAAECSTVRCDIGRRTGKSQYIRDNAGPDDVVIVHSPRAREAMGRLPCPVLTPGELLTRSVGHAATIYVDEPSAVFRQINRHDLYACLARDLQQTYILLGA